MIEHGWILTIALWLSVGGLIGGLIDTIAESHYLTRLQRRAQFMRISRNSGNLNTRTTDREFTCVHCKKTVTVNTDTLHSDTLKNERNRT